MGKSSSVFFFKMRSSPGITLQQIMPFSGISSPHWCQRHPWACLLRLSLPLSVRIFLGLSIYRIISDLWHNIDIGSQLHRAALPHIISWICKSSPNMSSPAKYSVLHTVVFGQVFSRNGFPSKLLSPTHNGIDGQFFPSKIWSPSQSDIDGQAFPYISSWAKSWVLHTVASAGISSPVTSHLYSWGKVLRLG